MDDNGITPELLAEWDDFSLEVLLSNNPRYLLDERLVRDIKLFRELMKGDDHEECC